MESLGSAVLATSYQCDGKHSPPAVCQGVDRLACKLLHVEPEIVLLLNCRIAKVVFAKDLLLFPVLSFVLVSVETASVFNMSIVVPIHLTGTEARSEEKCR